MSVGIIDIAKRLDVSHTTVSRVLNNRKGTFVSDKTRRQIEITAREMGYRPNLLARGLRGAKTETIGIAVPGFFKDIDPIELQARRAGYRVHMAAHHRGADDFQRVLEDFRQHNVDGVLVHSMVDGIGDILRKTLGAKPAVLCIEEPVEGFDCFIDARYQATRLAVSHLAERGHRRVGLLVNCDMPQMRWRVSGYRDQVRELGLEQDPALELTMPTDVPSASRGYAGLKTALTRLPRDRWPTAIICTNDDVAVGALAAAAELGVDVPGELSVVGMMSLDHAPFARVPLTTVDWNVLGLIAKGLDRLLERIRRPDLEPRVVLDPPRIIPRASVAPPAS